MLTINNLYNFIYDISTHFFVFKNNRHANNFDISSFAYILTTRVKNLKRVEINYKTHRSQYREM